MADRTIRVANESDAAALRRIYAPYVEDTAVTFEETPPSTGAMRERVAETLSTHPWLVCETDGEVVGYAAGSELDDFGGFRWSVESSVYVERSARGEGVGSALYESLLAVLALQGYVEVHALVAVPNPASVALHESVGFERAGAFEGVAHKNGAWRDMEWWTNTLRERPDDPDPPLSVSEARELEEWESALETGESAD